MYGMYICMYYITKHYIKIKSYGQFSTVFIYFFFVLKTEREREREWKRRRNERNGKNNIPVQKQETVKHSILQGFKANYFYSYQNNLLHWDLQRFQIKRNETSRQHRQNKNKNKNKTKKYKHI